MSQVSTVISSYLLQVYVCTVECDPVLAAARNVHKRSEAEVVRLARAWEDTPGKIGTVVNTYSISTHSVQNMLSPS